MWRTTQRCWTRWTANNGATTLALRRKLAQRAFARTAAYDAAVSNWFAGELAKDGDKAPPRRRALRRACCARRCAMARTRTRKRPSMSTGATRSGVATAEQLQGKELSYNNINDTDAAYELVAEFDPERVAGLRHHQARQSLRRGAGHDLDGRLSGGAGLRSGQRLRRRAGLQPARWTAQRRKRSPRSSPK